MLEGSILGTILFLAAFFACTAGVYRYKKSYKPQSGLLWVMISIVLTMCHGALIAGVIDLVHIPVNLYSMMAVFALTAVVLWYFIRKSGEKQEYEWDKFDVIASAVITIGVWAVLMKIFTPELHYAYFNSDAGLHLKEATAIVRSGELFGMYFNHLYNALVIEMIMPFVKTVDWYKGYVLADCIFLWMEIMFFFVLIRRYLTTKVSKGLSLLVMVAYFMGYPFLSFYYSFVYWGLGTMLVAFVIIALRLYEEAEVERKYTIYMLMLGCYGVMTCYMLFAPVTFVVVLFYLIVIARREGKIFSGKNVLLALKIFLIPTLLGGFYCLYGFFVSSGTSVSDALSNQGGIYTELYMDFFWTLFPVFFAIVHILKTKKRLTVDLTFFLGFFTFTGGMLMLTLTHFVSTYYYYKSYYPLWMLCWLLTFYAVTVMLKQAKETLIAYLMLVSMFVFLCFSTFEYRVVTSRENITGGLHSTAFFTLFQNNWSFITREHGEQDPEKMDLYEYIIENYADEEMIPLMTENLDYGETYFYEGVVGYDFPDFYEWRHEEDELAQAYVDWNVHYAVMLKGSDFDVQHGDELLDREDIQIVYETDAGYLLYLENSQDWGNSPLK